MSKHINQAIADLTAERDRLDAEFVEVANRNGGVDQLDEWPPGQVARSENLMRAINRLDDQIVALRAERANQREAIRVAAQEPSNREPGSPGREHERTAGGVARGRSPWSGLERAGTVDDLDGLRSRAADAVETFTELPDASREALTGMLDADRSTDAARAVMALGNPAYRGAFEKWLRSPETAPMDSTPAELAAWRDVASLRTALTTGNGAAIMPLTLDPAVVMTNDGAASGVRDYANVKLTTTNQFRAVTSAGVNAEWKVEGAEAADATPALGAADLSVWQGFASVMGSYELFEDTDAAAQLAGMFVDARVRLEAEAFVTGSGSNAPYGVVTRLTATTTSRVAPTTAGTFTTASVADIFKVRDAVPARHRQSPGVVWMANIAVASIIQQMSPAAQGGSFWTDLNGGVPARLLGIPFLEASSMVATATTGSNILLAVDLRDYVIADRLGTAVERHNVHGGSGGRSTGQWEFVARWRTAGDLVNPNAGRVLKL